MKAGSMKSHNLSQPQKQPNNYGSFVQYTDCSKMTVAIPEKKLSENLNDLDEKTPERKEKLENKRNLHYS